MKRHKRRVGSSQFDTVAERVDLSPPAPTEHTSEPDRPDAAWLAEATGVAAALVACGVTLSKREPWYAVLLWSLLAGGAATALSFSIASWVFVVLRVRRWLSSAASDEAAIGESTEQPTSTRREITVNIEEKGRIDRCVLFSPESRPAGLAFYAAALIRDEETRAAFSYAGGRHINGAKFYGYTPSEFTELEKEAKRAKLVYREQDNQPYELTERGRIVFGRVAEREMSEIQLSPAP